MLKFDPPKLREELAVAIEVWKRRVEPPRDDDFSDDLVDVTLPGFDPAEHEDKTITPKTEFGLCLPEWEDTAIISYGDFVELAAELEQARLIEGYACWTDRRYLLRVAPANDRTYAHLGRLLPEPESEQEREDQLAYVERDRERRAIRANLEPLLDRGIYRGDEGYDEELSAARDEASGKALELAGKIDKPTKRYLTMPVMHDGIDTTCSLTVGFTMFGIAVAASGDYDDDSPRSSAGKRS